MKNNHHNWVSYHFTGNNDKVLMPSYLPAVTQAVWDNSYKQGCLQSTVPPLLSFN
jgi:hypothetical protein